jgi:phospholipid/cholesterol/gamma-HCH transport system substrate-binding protein
MATRAQKTRVGAFLLLSFAIFAGAYYFLTDLNTVGMERYTMRFEESVLGLYVGSQVSFLGISVGTVDEIRVGAENNDYSPRSTSWWTRPSYRPVRLDCEKACAPSSKSSTSPPDRWRLRSKTRTLARRCTTPTTYIPTEQSLLGSFTSQSQDVMARAMDLLGETNQALSRVNTEIIGEVGETLQNINEFTAQATESLDTGQRNFEVALTDARAGMQDFRELAIATTELARNVNDAVTEMRAKLAPIDFAETEAEYRREFVALSQKLQQMADDLSTTTESVLYDADNVQYELVEVTRGLREAIEVLVEVVKPLRENPSALVRGRGQPRGRD